VIENVQGTPLANGGTKYDVTISGQAYSTFDPGLARQANERLGQQGIFNISMKPSRDGQRMFYNLDGIVGLQPEIPGVPMGGDMQPQMGQQIPIQPTATVVAPAPIPMAPMVNPVEREAKIVKQSSMATAFNFVGQLWQGAGPEAMEAAEEQAMALAKRMYVQVMGGPQTLDDEVIEALVAPQQEQPADETESWV